MHVKDAISEAPIAPNPRNYKINHKKTINDRAKNFCSCYQDSNKIIRAKFHQNLRGWVS